MGIVCFFGREKLDADPTVDIFIIGMDGIHYY
jgi:hypothetical protein